MVIEDLSGNEFVVRWRSDIPGTLVTVLQPNLILGSYREAIDDIFSGLIFPVTRICQWLPTSKRFGCQRPSLRSGDISLAYRRTNLEVGRDVVGLGDPPSH